MNRTLIALACVILTACGGGGGGGGGTTDPAPTFAAASVAAPGSGGTGEATSAPAPAAAGPAPSAPLSAAPPTSTQPDPNAVPTWPQGPDAPRSGRSLNWWGTEPQALFDENNACPAQPFCRIPDGDLRVWNEQCEPDQYFDQCYVPLSTEPQVRPADPRGPLPPLGERPTVQPDPMTATAAELAEWNRWCTTARCMLVQGVPR